VTFHTLPFEPTALAISSVTAEEQTSSLSSVDRVIYMTNSAVGSLPPNFDSLDEIYKTFMVGDVPVVDKLDMVSEESVFSFIQEGQSIMRVRADGTQVEVVARQVHRSGGIQVMSDPSYQIDTVLFTDASAGTVRAIVVPKMTSVLLKNVPAANSNVNGSSTQIFPIQDSVLLRGLEYPSSVAVDADRG
jgi:hypothetical protein